MENIILSIKINLYELKIPTPQGVGKWVNWWSDPYVVSMSTSMGTNVNNTLKKLYGMCSRNTYWKHILFTETALFFIFGISIAFELTASKSEDNVVSITVIFDTKMCWFDNSF